NRSVCTQIQIQIAFAWMHTGKSGGMHQVNGGLLWIFLNWSNGAQSLQKSHINHLYNLILSGKKSSAGVRGFCHVFSSCDRYSHSRTSESIPYVLHPGLSQSSQGFCWIFSLNGIDG